MAGGAAVPRSLIEAFDAIGIELLQGWGMTETSPLAAVALPPRGCPPDEEIDYRTKAGRIGCGVEARIVARRIHVAGRRRSRVGEFEVARTVGHAAYYKDRLRRPVPRRLAAHRGRRDPRSPGLHADHRPHQGRDQVRRGMDLLGRARERRDGPSRRVRGRRHRRRRSPMAGTSARVRRPLRGCLGQRGGAARAPSGPGGPLVASRALVLHRSRPQDLRGEVRQEGAPRRSRPTASSRCGSSSSRRPEVPVRR